MDRKNKAPKQQKDVNEYVNGVHPDEQPPLWTDRRREMFKDALRQLNNDGKLEYRSEKDVKLNMEQAVEFMSDLDPDFAKFKTLKGQLKKLKYGVLSSITRYFTQ